MVIEPVKNPYWTDESGNYYSWLEDLWSRSARLEAERAARGEPYFSLVMASERPKPKLSSLVNYLNEIRSTPHLMDKIRRLASAYPTPESLRNSAAGALED